MPESQENGVANADHIFDGKANLLHNNILCNNLPEMQIYCIIFFQEKSRWTRKLRVDTDFLKKKRQEFPDHSRGDTLATLRPELQTCEFTK